MFRVNRRKDFPVLSSDQAYFDHAASSLTPDPVIAVMNQYYQQYRSNVHRGVYEWSARATIAYEDARSTVAAFVNAPETSLVFTSGATASINLVAEAYASNRLKPGQAIIISPLEHHSNMIPWQQVAKRCQCKLRYLELNPDYSVDFDKFDQILQEEDVALIAITHASNVLGIKNDIKKISAYGIPVMVDGTQMVSHEPVDVSDLGCAFYAFSAHKMYGPTGIGALYIAPKYWVHMQACYTGGGMVQKVTYQTATFQGGPQLFEAGTPNIAAAIGFAEACRYIQGIGFSEIKQHEALIMSGVFKVLGECDIQWIGPQSGALSSFVYPGVHAHDVATVLADKGVMVRAGHHCCMPLMSALGVAALTRVSIGVHNTVDDVCRLKVAMEEIARVMQL